MVSAKLGASLPLLCLVTDRLSVPPATLADKVRLAVQGGAGMVQVREKDLPTAALAAQARELQDACAGKAFLIVNGDPEAAVLAGADGIHLPEDDISTAEARRRTANIVLIGRSVHSLEGALKAEAGGADYLIVGTIFETLSHPGKPPQGLTLLEQVARAVRIPILGIGGITAANAASVMAAGASGVAVISAILSATDPHAAAAALYSVISRNPRRDPLQPPHPITLTINGKPQSLEHPTPLLEYLSTRLEPQRMVAIGLNGQVVLRQEWANVVLKQGDVVDIVHMVGGGSPDPAGPSHRTHTTGRRASGWTGG